MTTYILAPNGVFQQRLSEGNFLFSPTVFQPASTLTPEQRTEFGVFELVNTAQPAYDTLSQNCMDSGTELVAGQWTQVWAITPATAGQVQSRGTAIIQNFLDATARTRGYDGILSACTYAVDTNPTFHAEGLACVAWRSSVWAACYQIMGEVQAGTRPIPTEVELLAAMPAIVW